MSTSRCLIASRAMGFDTAESSSRLPIWLRCLPNSTPKLAFESRTGRFAKPLYCTRGRVTSGTLYRSRRVPVKLSEHQFANIHISKCVRTYNGPRGSYSVYSQKPGDGDTSLSFAFWPASHSVRKIVILFDVCVYLTLIVSIVLRLWLVSTVWLAYCLNVK